MTVLLAVFTGEILKKILVGYLLGVEYSRVYGRLQRIADVHIGYGIHDTMIHVYVWQVLL